MPAIEAAIARCLARRRSRPAGRWPATLPLRHQHRVAGVTRHEPQGRHRYRQHVGPDARAAGAIRHHGRATERPLRTGHLSRTASTSPPTSSSTGWRRPTACPPRRSHRSEPSRTVFLLLATDHDEVCCVLISSRLSGTFQSAPWPRRPSPPMSMSRWSTPPMSRPRSACRRFVRLPLPMTARMPPLIAKTLGIRSCPLPHDFLR